MSDVPWPRVVLHVDMDAFFAAVEQRDHPEWRGRPVVVGADPKGGEGRGVVSTASYEARRFGIGSAMPISHAYRACPDAVFVRPDIERYRVEAGRLRRVFRESAGDAVEPVSIDEAYLEVTSAVREGRYRDGAEAGRELKRRVFEETALTCSVGVAPSKSVAKIASDMQKPDGLTVVPPDDVRTFLEPLPVRRLQGVGPKTAAALTEESIETIGDLARRPSSWMTERFGKNGAWLLGLARGEDDRPVEPDQGLPKSRSEEHTFERDTADASAINRVVRTMARELVDEMRAEGILFRVVGLKIRTEAFETFTRATTLRAPTHRSGPVLAILREQLEEFLDGRRRYRLVGVRLAGLERDIGQRTLEEYVVDAGEATGPLSRFPPWSVPGATVPRPGQWRFGRDV
ncbi:MAG: DNA polymerase IV [Euryarchaeota archaeon]|nr:DNA polymerase IV [Euryarchaeota archaeon]